MPTFPYVTVDAFTSTRYAGNPLAIVLLPPAEAEQGAGAGTDLTASAPPTLSTAQMQRIAQEFNYSETVFLHAALPSGESATLQWRIRIFTTEAELPFAGHPTIGAAVYALSQQEGSVLKGQLLCAAGTIHISLSDDVVPPAAAATTSSLEQLLVHAEIPHNFHAHSEHPFTVDDVLALQPSLRSVPEALNPEAITIASPVKGMNFILIQLPDLSNLGKIAMSPKPRPVLDRDWNMGFVATYFYVLLENPSSSSSSDGEGEAKVRTRMIEGGFEDPATGSAACALATHLALEAAEAKTKGRRQRFEITQGVEMGRTGVIRVDVTLGEGGGGLERLVLSGNAVRVMEGRVEY